VGAPPRGVGDVAPLVGITELERCDRTDGVAGSSVAKDLSNAFTGCACVNPAHTTRIETNILQVNDDAAVTADCRERLVFTDFLPNYLFDAMFADEHALDAIGNRWRNFASVILFNCRVEAMPGFLHKTNSAT
jgi:hypothetical protein